jgi:hypothetical protein
LQVLNKNQKKTEKKREKKMGNSLKEPGQSFGPKTKPARGPSSLAPEVVPPPSLSRH